MISGGSPGRWLSRKKCFLVIIGMTSSNPRTAIAKNENSSKILILGAPIERLWPVARQVLMHDDACCMPISALAIVKCNDVTPPSKSNRNEMTNVFMGLLYHFRLDTYTNRALGKVELVRPHARASLMP